MSQASPDCFDVEGLASIQRGREGNLVAAVI